MSQFDKATQNFMSTVAADKPPSSPHPVHDDDSVYKTIKQVAGIAKSPAKALSTLALRSLMHNVESHSANKALEKTSGLTTIGIYKFLNENYGRDWWDWEPETIWQTLKMDGIEVDETLKDTVLALQVCVNTMAPFEHWHIFENVGHAFNGNPVTFSALQPMEPDECALACKILSLIQPKTPYESEVLGYIAMCARSAGLVFLPDQLFPPGVSEILDDVTWDKDLIKKTRQVWYSKGRKASSEDVEVQIGRLQEIEDYVRSLGA